MDILVVLLGPAGALAVTELGWPAYGLALLMTGAIVTLSLVATGHSGLRLSR